jgi:hypothetical protein
MLYRGFHEMLLLPHDNRPIDGIEADGIEGLWGGRFLKIILTDNAI